MDAYRKERIERLLEELRYEVTRGLMEDEIEPFVFSFELPRRPSGYWHCRFTVRQMEISSQGPTLRSVEAS